MYIHRTPETVEIALLVSFDLGAPILPLWAGLHQCATMPGREWHCDRANRANQGAVNDCAWEQMIGKQISPIIASASEGARAEL
jgi:hypothetical protein